MQRIDLLDNGYVQLVEAWGSDSRFIEAARMSTQQQALNAVRDGRADP